MRQINPKTYGPTSELALFYEDTRALSIELTRNLSDADATVQSMEDASPAKWHLAHTTWFFETLILKKFLADYRVFDERFAFLFNSYYEALGSRHPRPHRGMLTRPSLVNVFDYRDYVDDHMEQVMADPDLMDMAADLIRLGLHHEQQHQELLLTDILHLFAQSPLKPEFRPAKPEAFNPKPNSSLDWSSYKGGLYEFGNEPSDEFAYDCEGPRHKVWLNDYQLANRLVTNRDWIDFMDQGGYETATLWLSDGWAKCQDQDWHAPLYWEKRGSYWWSMTLRGFQPVDLDAPVCHISLFEADAFARFAGARLPTEYEWENAAIHEKIQGNVLNLSRLRPTPAKQDETLCQMFGDVWEWTQSAYAPYPGFKACEGAIGEYNGKFMNGQYVLRGGSCVTPKGHIRSTYRNFFHPDKRWQFSGLRLARDL